MVDGTALLRQWFAKLSKKQKLTAGLLAFSLLATAGLLSVNGASETAGDPLGSTPFYLVGVFIKLIGVLLLIFACAVIFRRWMPFGPSGRAVKQMRLIETVRLSPKQALHLVSIGDQQILIGATDQSISLLSQSEVNLGSPSEDVTNPPQRSDFGVLLQSVSSQLPAEPFK